MNKGQIVIAILLLFILIVLINISRLLELNVAWTCIAGESDTVVNQRCHSLAADKSWF